MNPTETIQEQFSTTLHSKADQLQQTRSVINKIAHYKYNAKNNEDLAENIGLSTNVINNIVNDYFLINHLLPHRGESYSKDSSLKHDVNLSLQAISPGKFAQWLLSKSEFETIVLFFLYIENKNYEQTANDIIILDVDAVIQIQVNHIKNLANDILALDNTYMLNNCDKTA